VDGRRSVRLQASGFTGAARVLFTWCQQRLRGVRRRAWKAKWLVAGLAGAVALSALALWVLTPSGEHVQQRVSAEVRSRGDTLLQPTDVPRLLAAATVATEDERFYHHHGIDVIGLGRALLFDARHRCGCQGGSTITEQLVKGVYLHGSDHGAAKIVDLVLAFKVEFAASKPQILADYLSEIPTGPGLYGVSDAACAYFDAPLGRLDLAQYALLAGLTQAPTLYDPLQHPDAALARRGEVLNLMVSEHDITAAQATQAAREGLSLHPGGPRCAP
jgi:penicillin-binding protein 2A